MANVQRGPERLEKQMDRNSMKIIKGRCKARPLGWTKSCSRSVCGQLAANSSAEQALQTTGWQCPCAAISHPDLSRAAQARVQSAGPETDFAQQPGIHKTLLNVVPSLWLPCTAQTLTYWCECQRGRWGNQGWNTAHPRRGCTTWVCSAFKKRKAEGKHDCYLQL